MANPVVSIMGGGAAGATFGCAGRDRRTRAAVSRANRAKAHGKGNGRRQAARPGRARPIACRGRCEGTTAQDRHGRGAPAAPAA